MKVVEKTKKNDEHNWKYAFKSSAEPIKIAEPMHRVGPKGVSSGVSFRNLPPTCIEQVKAICVHYVNKCSGQYHNNKVAARYVHQFASEVLSQLQGITAEIEQHNEMSKAMIQSKRDWEEYFPPSLNSLGTPRDIAQLIDQQRKEITELRNRIDSFQTNKASDMSNILRSMDAQLNASRNGALAEREQLKAEFEQLRTYYEQHLKDTLEAHQRAIANLKDDHRSQIQSLTMAKNSDINRWKVAFENLQSDMEMLRASHQHELDVAKEESAQRENDLQDEIKHLKKQMKQLSADDDKSVSSTTSMDSRGFSIGGHPDSVGGGMQEGAHKASAFHRKKAKILKKKIASMKEQMAAKDAQVAKIEEELRRAITELYSNRRHISNLKEMNELLRYELKMKFDAPISGDIKLSFSPRPMEYVPDFLNKRGPVLVET